MARDRLGDKVVPKVLLEATHKDTLVRDRSCPFHTPLMMAWAERWYHP